MKIQFLSGKDGKGSGDADKNKEKKKGIETAEDNNGKVVNKKAEMAKDNHDNDDSYSDGEATDKDADDDHGHAFY